MRIIKPDQETWFWLGYVVCYFGLAFAIAQCIRFFPLPILGAETFNEDVWYTFVFKIGFLLVIPCAILWRQGYRPRDLLPEWRPYRYSQRLCPIDSGPLGNRLRAQSGCDARGALLTRLLGELGVD